MEKRIKGLHSLLPNSEEFFYSILIPVYRPDPKFFEKALRSAFKQSAPHCEILLGFDGPQPLEIKLIAEKFQKLETDQTPQIRIVEIDREKAGGGISNTTNVLAKEAKGNFLLLMDHDDWISPDLLYRYEQCLRLFQDRNNVVLYCDEYKIDQFDSPILYSYTTKPQQPVFPYVFVNFICHCLLIPKNLWIRTGGLRPQCDGAQDYDLCLRLDLVGAQFQNIPFYLYAWRSHAGSTAKNPEAKNYASAAGVKALADYCQAKGLDWNVSDGYIPTTYRAVPRKSSKVPVQIVIPFKDQKKLTLSAVKSVLNQKGVEVFITAADNRSEDRSISEELKKLGVEVLRIDEPFNYSRINNLSVKNSRFSSKCPQVLFLNNDVDLDVNAIAEMTQWLGEPHIGMVGARLHYPDGTLQHGGVQLKMDFPTFKMGWGHVDWHCPPDKLGFSKVISICDAVTAACVLMERENFLKVGGFDEIWYPIAFSDTDLAVKFRTRLGLHSLYTPYAFGTHHESASRGPGIHEEMESSTWLFRNTEFRDIPQARLRHSVFPNKNI